MATTVIGIAPEAADFTEFSRTLCIDQRITLLMKVSLYNVCLYNRDRSPGAELGKGAGHASTREPGWKRCLRWDEVE